MLFRKTSPFTLLAALLMGSAASSVYAAPVVTRLTPPSELFSNQHEAPIIARFLPGQRFDLQATVRPDDATKRITGARFAVDGKNVQANIAIKDCESLCLKGIPANAAIVSSRAISVDHAGIHSFSVTATQSDGQTVTATGNFEVVALSEGAQKVKNIIILLGDGMGAAQRTAARIVGGGNEGQTPRGRGRAAHGRPSRGLLVRRQVVADTQSAAPGDRAGIDIDRHQFPPGRRIAGRAASG